MVPVDGAHEGDHGQHGGHAQSGPDQDESKINWLCLKEMHIFDRLYIKLIVVYFVGLIKNNFVGAFN